MNWLSILLIVCIFLVCMSLLQNVGQWNKPRAVIYRPPPANYGERPNNGEYPNYNEEYPRYNGEYPYYNGEYPYYNEEHRPLVNIVGSGRAQAGGAPVVPVVPAKINPIPDYQCDGPICLNTDLIGNAMAGSNYPQPCNDIMCFNPNFNFAGVNLSY